MSCVLPGTGVVGGYVLVWDTLPGVPYMSMPDILPVTGADYMGMVWFGTCGRNAADTDTTSV